MALRKVTDKIIYGPVHSRRLNRSLGINLLPAGEKLCNFNCVYCQYGKTQKFFDTDKEYDFPTLSEVDSAIANFIAGIGEPREYIDYITFSGNGEPTIYPDFYDVVNSITTIRDEMIPKVSTSVLTNGSILKDEKVREAILLIDIPIIKLDCGCEETFVKLNRPSKNITFNDILNGLKGVNNAVIQAIFIASDKVDNSTDDEVEKWLGILSELDIREIQLYTLDRPPAEDNVKPITEERLWEIAKTAEKALKRPARVY